MFKLKLPKQEQGFTMVEVLIAILIATIFVAVTMQMMAIAAMFKVRAQEYAEATAWIQEDLENLKYQASQLGIKNVVSMAVTTNLITITNHGFNDGDIVVFQADGTIAGGLSTNTTYYVKDATTNTFKLETSAGGTAIVLTSASTGSLSAMVTSILRCNATRTTGYADALRDLFTGSDQTGIDNVVVDPASSGNTDSTGTAHPGTALSSKLFTTKRFHLSRTTTMSSDAPYRVLQISYSVAPEDAHTTLSSAAAATSTTLSVVSASGFKSGDKLTVGTDTDNEIQSISGNTITLKAALGSDQPSGSIVDASVATTSTEIIPNAALQCPN